MSQPVLFETNLTPVILSGAFNSPIPSNSPCEKDCQLFSKHQHYKDLVYNWNKGSKTADSFESRRHFFIYQEKLELRKTFWPANSFFWSRFSLTTLCFLYNMRIWYEFHNFSLQEENMVWVSLLIKNLFVQWEKCNFIGSHFLKHACDAFWLPILPTMCYNITKRCILEKSPKSWNFFWSDFLLGTNLTTK